MTGETFQPVFEPLPQERDPASDLQAELGALLSAELQTPVQGTDVATARPLWADDVMAFLECSMTPGNAACAQTDPRLRSQAAVNAQDLYRRLFEDEAAIAIWLKADRSGGEAQSYLSGFAELFTNTAELLAEDEQARLRRMVLRPVAPKSMSDAELDSLVP